MLDEKVYQKVTLRARCQTYRCRQSGEGSGTAEEVKHPPGGAEKVRVMRNDKKTVLSSDSFEMDAGERRLSDS